MSLRASGPASILVSLLVSAVLPLLPAGSGPVAQEAFADPLSSAQAEAAQITSQIQSEGEQLDILSQRYDAAEQQVQQLVAEVTQMQSRIAQTKQRVANDQATLRRQALATYMDGTNTGLEELFAGVGMRGSLTKEYGTVAAGNVSSTIDALHLAQLVLVVQETQLQGTESQAQTAASQLSADEASARAAQQQQEQTLNQVKGQIAALVAQQQAAEAQAQEEAFQARQAAEAAAATEAASERSSSQGSGSPTYVAPEAAQADVPVAPGGEGAVQAAQTQLGVPYVWGGETPGVGFDCSGLTQWAWGQAGVQIPRTAQEQYDAIVHVSLSDLEPGDLLFWNDGTSSIQHVAMYVGGDTVIQAPETGETVSYATIWDSGLVGAGRP